MPPSFGGARQTTIMALQSLLELEILGTLHGLLFNDQGKRKESSVTGQTIIDQYEKIYASTHVNEAIRNLSDHKFIEAKLSGLAVPEMKYSWIDSTLEGDAAIRKVVDPFWICDPAWKTKYPRIKEELLPWATDERDWRIFRTLFENTSWDSEYVIDEDVARGHVLDDADGTPVFGKFLKKFQGAASLAGIHYEAHIVEGKGQVQHLRLEAKFKPLVMEDFSAFKTAEKYYGTLTTLFKRIKFHRKPVDEFLANFRDCLGRDQERMDETLMVDHLLSVELINIYPHGAGYGLSLQNVVDEASFKEWRLRYLIRNYFPKHNWVNLLESKKKIIFNGSDFVPTEKDQVQEMLTAAEESGPTISIPSTPPEPERVKAFIGLGYIQELKEIQNQKFDLRGLIEMCEEINRAYDRGDYLALIALVRTILNHVPPIFGQQTFERVVAHYGGTGVNKSFKGQMEHLLKGAKNLADEHLHKVIGPSVKVLNEESVNYAPLVNSLIGEIIQILRAP